SAFTKAGFGGDRQPLRVFPTAIQYPTRTNENRDTDLWRDGHDVRGIRVLLCAGFLYDRPGRVGNVRGQPTPTALVVDSGYAVTWTLPVHDHAPLVHPSRMHDVSGQAIDDWLQQTVMNEVGVELPSNGAWGIALWLAKTERCRVARDFEEESMRWKKSVNDGGHDEIWELPDGLKVKPNTPLGLRAGEVSFNPSMLGLDVGGLQYDAFNVIMNCNRDIRDELCQNVLLAGGNTLFPGFGARFKCELKGLFKEGTKINVISPRNRAYSAWVGGSMLSELSTFEGMCVTRAEYEEGGPEIANKKFL
ncbi:actin, partial [Colletotrichum salicis]